jgi:hypothetical protein
MRLRVTDVRALPALTAHLVLQGFPARAIGDGMIEVLFPAEPSALPAAAELDVWSAANGGATVVPVQAHKR